MQFCAKAANGKPKAWHGDLLFGFLLCACSSGSFRPIVRLTVSQRKQVHAGLHSETCPAVPSVSPAAAQTLSAFLMSVGTASGKVRVTAIFSDVAHRPGTHSIPMSSRSRKGNYGATAQHLVSAFLGTARSRGGFATAT